MGVDIESFSRSHCMRRTSTLIIAFINISDPDIRTLSPIHSCDPEPGCRSKFGTCIPMTFISSWGKYRDRRTTLAADGYGSDPPAAWGGLLHGWNHFPQPQHSMIILKIISSASMKQERNKEEKPPYHAPPRNMKPLGFLSFFVV